MHRAIVDAIYSGIEGAKLQNISSLNGEVWVVDCQAEVNVTIKIGGQSFPLHPLDVVQTDVDDSGNTFCYGTVSVMSHHARCDALG